MTEFMTEKLKQTVLKTACPQIQWPQLTFAEVEQFDTHFNIPFHTARHKNKLF